MKASSKELLFSAIGIIIMFLGFILPPLGPLSVVGMHVLFIFIGALWLWSTVGGVWPSLAAIFMFSLSGYFGEGSEGFSATFVTLFGDDTFILLILMFTLFSGVKMSGCMDYVARWILTRKCINGHPYLIIVAISFTAYLIAAATNAPAALMISWSILAGICSMAGIEHGKDKIWAFLFGGVFLGAGLGHCAMPFKTTGLAMNRAYNGIMQGEYAINTLGYIAFSVAMTFIMIFVLIILMRVLFKPDVTKLKNLSIEDIIKSSNLAQINKTQKAYLIILPIFVVCLMLPTVNSLNSFAPVAFLGTIGFSGTAMLFLIIMALIKLDGKPMLNFALAAKNGIMWNIVLLVIVAKNMGTALSNADLGVTTAIKEMLNPILGGKPELFVVFIILLAALIATNFANNVSMAITFMPVIKVFAAQLSLNPAPITICVMILVFIAMMTPGASTQASMCYASEYYTPKEIRSYAIPLSLIAVVVFTLIGYPLAKILVG